MKYRNKIIWITIFSIAMGFMESAVVVYLREIYYPDGFQFPLVIIEPNIALTEFLREAATIIMLLGIGLLTGKTASRKFAIFIYCFAIWDIFYYVFLKLLLAWPASLFTWDILFLIPVPWVGPVITPVLGSLFMILFAGSIEYYAEKGKDTRILRRERVLFIVGSIVVITSFIWDYIKYINNGGNSKSVWTLNSDRQMFSEISNYIPETFNWLLFSVGMLVILAGIINFNLRMRR